MKHPSASKPQREENELVILGWIRMFFTTSKLDFNWWVPGKIQLTWFCLFFVFGSRPVFCKFLGSSLLTTDCDCKNYLYTTRDARQVLLFYATLLDANEKTRKEQLKGISQPVRWQKHWTIANHTRCSHKNPWKFNTVAFWNWFTCFTIALPSAYNVPKGVWYCWSFKNPGCIQALQILGEFSADQTYMPSLDYSVRHHRPELTTNLQSSSH